MNYMQTPMAMHVYRVEHYNGFPIVFRRIYSHPYWGWEIVHGIGDGNLPANGIDGNGYSLPYR